MHEEQVDVSEADLAAAVAAQFPDLAGLPVRRVTSAGTTVAPYRIGEHLVARVPLVPDLRLAARIESEGRHAEELRRALPVDVPEIVGLGREFANYPGVWSIWTWVAGESLDQALDAGEPLDQETLARDLAALLTTQRTLPAGEGEWSRNRRGGSPLSDSEWVRASIGRSRHLVDEDRATEVWERALAAPPYAARPVRINADPLPGNLLLRDGRLAALIDIGDRVIGDPAADLQAAWEIFDEPARGVFRAAMGLDHAAWERGRGWAFEMAIGGIHYYERTNPVFHRLAARTLERLLAD